MATRARGDGLMNLKAGSFDEITYRNMSLMSSETRRAERERLHSNARSASRVELCRESKSEQLRMWSLERNPTKPRGWPKMRPSREKDLRDGERADVLSLP